MQPTIEVRNYAGNFLSIVTSKITAIQRNNDKPLEQTEIFVANGAELAEPFIVCEPYDSVVSKFKEAVK